MAAGFTDSGANVIDCTFVRQIDWQELKDKVNVWKLAGRDGYGVQVLGSGDGRFSFEAILFGTLTEVDDWGALLEGLQGDVVTIRDDFNVLGRPALTDRQVLSVDVAKVLPAFPPVTRFRGSAIVSGVALS